MSWMRIAAVLVFCLYSFQAIKLFCVIKFFTVDVNYLQKWSKGRFKVEASGKRILSMFLDGPIAFSISPHLLHF